MNKVQQSYVGFVSMALVVGATFAACGGLDPRKVSRGPEDGGDKGGEGSDPKPGSGGSANNAAGGGGGEVNNPFGGDKGYDGGAPPVVDGPPTVVEVSPGDEAEDAEPNDNIALRFSEGLDPDTVTLDNVKIMDGDTEVDGELSYEGIDALFEPTRRLSLLTTYDVSVSTGVTDAGGIAMAEPFTSKFTVRDGRWGALTQAFDDDNWYGSQDIGIAANGNALVVYSRVTDAQNGQAQAFARWYRVVGGWQPEQPLETKPVGVTGMRVAVSPEGDAIAAWWIYEEGSYRLRATRFSGGSWEAEPQYVEQMAATELNDNFASEISLAARAGRVIVAWVRSTYQKVSPYTSYNYLTMTSTSIDGAWPEYPTSNYSTTYVTPYYAQVVDVQAALDAKGNALVTFVDKSSNVQPTYGGGVYYARKPVDDETWQYPTKIPTTDNSANTIPQLASDGSGAMLVWSALGTNGVYRVLASRYTVAKQFVAPIEIGDPELTEAVYFPQKALVSDGKSFHTVWTQYVGSASNAYVQRFDVSTGKWDAAPVPISDGIARVNYGEAAIGVDAHGNALATFQQFVGQYDSILMGARFKASTGEWTAADPLTEEGHGYWGPTIAVAENGIAALLFRGGGRDHGQTAATVGAQLLTFK